MVRELAPDDRAVRPSGVLNRFFLQLGWEQAACFGITISLCGLQVLGSCRWMQRFPLGPAEWLWRPGNFRELANWPEVFETLGKSSVWNGGADRIRTGG